MSVPCELFLLGYIILQMTGRKKWDPERVKAATEAMRNKEIGSYKASRVFNVPRTTPERYVKDRQESSSETITTKLCRKQVLSCEAENDLAEYCLLMERKFLVFKKADVMHLAYELAVRNGIKNRFWKRDEKTGRK
jgi:predicted transcriptional regulator